MRVKNDLQRLLIGTGILAAVLTVTACETVTQTRGERLTLSPAEIEAREAASRRARIRDLQAEVDAQDAYLRQNLGTDRAYITDNGDFLSVALSGEGMFFDRSARLTSAGLDQLAILAASLEVFPETRLALTGHVLSTGRPQIDTVLSERRAVAAKSALMARGIDPCRIAAQGAGASDPVAPRTPQRSNRYNDRLEIVIEPKQDGACT